MKKVLFFFGTRPEAIKLAPIIREFKNSKVFETKVCVTGQHREMLDQVLTMFSIKSDFDLDLMRHNQELTSLAGTIIDQAGKIIAQEEPTLVIVHGDTTTAMAASIASFYKGVEVAHVEAGLRTSTVLSPFPEEFNRRVVSNASTINFCPTEINRNNLIAEGKDDRGIFVTGNSAIDALQIALSENRNDEHYNNISAKVGFNIKEGKYILITGHRRENQGKKFDAIFRAIARIAEDFEDYKIVYPVHLSPPVQRQVKEHFSNSDQIRLIAPMDYFEFASVMEHSFLVMTDSGGIQEEAPSLNIPVVVFREETERTEGLRSGTIVMGGVDEKNIYEQCKRLIEDEEFYKTVALAENPYGNGNSRHIILDVVEKYLLGECLGDI